MSQQGPADTPTLLHSQEQPHDPVIHSALACTHVRFRKKDPSRVHEVYNWVLTHLPMQHGPEQPTSGKAINRVCVTGTQLCQQGPRS